MFYLTSVYFLLTYRDYSHCCNDVERNISEVGMGHLFSISHPLDTKQGKFVANTFSDCTKHTYTHAHTHAHSCTRVNMCTRVDAHSHFTANKDPARDTNQSCLISQFSLISARHISSKIIH